MIDAMALDRSPPPNRRMRWRCWRLPPTRSAGGCWPSWRRREPGALCDLQPVGGVAPNVLSYHLKVLREAGLVTAAKRGRWVDYTLADDAHARIAAALPTAGTLHAQHLPVQLLQMSVLERVPTDRRGQVGALAGAALLWWVLYR